MTPPLELIRYEILEFSYKTNLKYTGKNKKWDVLTTVVTSIAADDPFLYKVTLGIKSNNSNKGIPPYKFTLNMVGMFKAAESIENEEERKMVVARNGSSMLYSAAREYTFIATCHGLYAPITLPTVSFYNLQKVDKVE